MAREGVLRAGVLRAARGFNPLRAAWWLFGNVRWAIALIAFLVAVSLLGLFLPQIPASLRGDPAGEAQWVALQKDTFGPLTEWMHRVGLFDVFRARWFAVALGLLVASTAVYIIGRFPSIWQTVTRPRKRVADRYFEVAPQRAAYATPPDAAALERVLRRRWYAVERFTEGETTYLFADRFRWAELGTLFTHAAIILFIVAAVASHIGGFSRDLLVAEGESAPVFEEVANPNQMQVQVVDAVGSFDEQGQPLDYRSQLVIYQGGEEVKRCVATVNSPCGYNGYRFHQAAYFGFGAEIQVRDLSSGNVIYREILALSDTIPGPHVIVRDANGQVLLDEALLLTEYVQGTYGRLVSLPGDGRAVWMGARHEQPGGWTLIVLEPSRGGDAVRLLVPQGQEREMAGLSFQFAGLSATPASLEPEFPLPPGVVADSDSGTVLAEMSNVVYGTGDASAGTALEVPRRQGPPTLTIVGLTPQPLSLEPGQSATIGGYEYRFLGQREFSGIEVKKDRSDLLIWVASGLLLAGLFVTFWVPRRRLWAKITSTHTFLAGQGGHLAGFQREVRRLARESGAAEPSLEARAGQESGND